MREEISKSQNLSFFHILTRLIFEDINIREINFAIEQNLLMKIFLNRNYHNEKQKKKRNCIQIFVFLNLLD